MRRNQPRGQSVNAARCAVLSTFALLGCAVAQGSLRATLAVVWVLLLITAFTLEWSARRRARVPPPPPPRAAARRAGKARQNRAR